MLSYISQGGLGGDVPPFYYSWGLRDAGKKLKTAYPGQVHCYHFDHTQDAAMVDAIERAFRRADAILCATHSLGANGFLNTALPECARRKIIIGCAFTFDPTWNVWAAQIGNEVRRLINYRNTAFFSALGKRNVYAKSGYDGYLVNIPLNVLHQNLDDDLGAHAMIIREAGWLLNPQAGSATLPTSSANPPRPTPIMSVQQQAEIAGQRDLSTEFKPTNDV